MRGGFGVVGFVVKLREFPQRDSLLVPVGVRPLVAPDGRHRHLQLVALVALPHRAPHPRILGAQSRRPLVVIQRVVGHGEDLVGLPEAVPGSVVPRVDVHRVPVRVNGRRRVLHLHVLVAHERPRAEVLPVQTERPGEVHHRLLVLRLEGVVVTHDAARLGPVLVGQHRAVRQVGQLRGRLLHVQDVTVRVHPLEPVRVRLVHVLEDALRAVKLAHVVVADRHLHHADGRRGNVHHQRGVRLQALAVILQLELQRRDEPLAHPVVR
mmetsp:Transcript_6199/g.27928  ORF Transcript_6199/g.27928 Transcript_6199/m.27928 type:complete len:266 (-) Transcript_6199:1037-1834(-)